MQDPRLIAFYLPQYHPIPENDEWWGKGFTEWRNVTKAKPRFPGHYQPHLPADLGFYDLRLPEAREAQAELARAYGIHGFCYYHYWFNGRRLLERPFNEVLSSGKPDLPFCLCWANENWTRRWDGQEQELLLCQNYTPEDDLAHIRSLAPALRDPRYIRVDGKPMLLVYRAGRLPNPLQTTGIWRDEAHKLGLGEILLCRVEAFQEERADPKRIGFDAAVEFQPDGLHTGAPDCTSRARRIGARLGLLSEYPPNGDTIFSYPNVVDAALNKLQATYRRFPCVMPSWDNSARRAKEALIFRDSSPAAYGDWLAAVIAQEYTKAESPVVFINAWNEWAEGNHLEPDLKYGHAYLEATKAAIIKGMKGSDQNR